MKVFIVMCTITGFHGRGFLLRGDYVTGGFVAGGMLRVVG